MPLPSVFQGVQDCRLPALKPPKCSPQASKATTLTATCPCHLFFRGFKTAVCPPSNPPNASAGLQGNNSYSYMPLTSVFQGVQDCRLPGLKPSKRFRRPPRQQLLQLHAPAIFQGKNSYSYMPLPSVFQGVQDCRLPGLKPPKRFRRPPRQQLLQLHAPAICFSGGSRLPFARPQTFQTLPQASKATTLTATCPCHHLFFRRFKTAVCPPSNPPNAPAGLQGNNSYSYMPLASVFQGVQDCRLPALKPPKRFRRPPRQQLLQLHAPAICFSGGSRLPFARPQTPQTPQTLPQGFKATTLTATCPCHLFFRGFNTAVCPTSNPPNAANPPAGLQGNNSYRYMPLPSVFFNMPLPSVFQEVQDCRLPALKPPTLRNASAGLQGNNSYSYMPLPSVFQGIPDCCLPALKPGFKATTLTATCPCHLFFRGFQTAVCPPSNPRNASAGLQGNNSYSYMSLPSVFQGVQDCRLPALKPPKRFRRPPRQQAPQASKATTLTGTCPCHLFFSTCPCHLFFRRFKTAGCPPSNPPNASAGLQGNNSYSYMPLPSVFQGIPDCCLPALKPGFKATTLTATCPCHLFFRGFQTAVCPPSNPRNASAGLQGNNSYSYMSLPSVFQGVQDCRLPALKPPKRLAQTLPQASKATTLTATCPCHLFFRGFKTAVCPASNLPNASAGLQGNNSYSYMPLPSVFQEVQDCHLPALKPPKRFRRPPRQQLLQLHVPAICFSGGSRLQFARPQTPKRFQPSRRPSRQQLLQLHAPAICFSGS